MSCLSNGVWICMSPDMHVMEIKVPSRVNIASSVNKSSHRNCGFQTHCSKHHWQNVTRQGKSSGLRPCTRCRWYGYSRSSCSILQTALWTSYVILKRVTAHERKSISRNLFTFGTMLIGTFLLKWGWGIPRKSLWHRFWDILYIYRVSQEERT
jgi:hypothetical protein